MPVASRAESAASGTGPTQARAGEGPRGGPGVLQARRGGPRQGMRRPCLFDPSSWAGRRGLSGGTRDGRWGRCWRCLSWRRRRTSGSTSSSADPRTWTWTWSWSVLELLIVQHALGVLRPRLTRTQPARRHKPAAPRFVWPPCRRAACARLPEPPRSGCRRARGTRAAPRRRRLQPARRRRGLVGASAARRGHGKGLCTLSPARARAKDGLAGWRCPSDRLVAAVLRETPRRGAVDALRVADGGAASRRRLLRRRGAHACLPRAGGHLSCVGSRSRDACCVCVALCVVRVDGALAHSKGRGRSCCTGTRDSEGARAGTF